MDDRRRIRWAYLVLGVAVLGVALVLSVGSGGDGDDAADEAPLSAELEMLDGGTVSLADYRGAPLVVNFFASWCAPCRAEMPAFEQVHQGLEGRVAFVGVNLQDSVEAGRALVEETGVSYDIARDPDGTLFADFGGTSMPTTLLVDADGHVVEVISGAISGDALATKIDTELLA